jgi:hypothetical protein
MVKWIMSKKKSFVLRIDPEKLDALEKWAADEFRSINGQLEWIIDQALKKSGRMNKKSSNGTETDSGEQDENLDIQL